MFPFCSLSKCESIRIYRRAFRELQPVHMLLKPKDEWIQSRNKEPSTGSKMSSMRKYTYVELISLRAYRGLC